MILAEDYFTQNKNESANNCKNVEEAINKIILTSCSIKRMESSNSIKSNDIYYIQSSSRFSENFPYKNTFDNNNNNSSGLMCADFDSSFANLVNKDNNFSEMHNNNNKFSSFSGKNMAKPFVKVIDDNDLIRINNPAIINGKEKGKFEEEKNVIKIETLFEIEIKEEPMEKKSKRRLITKTDTSDKCFPFTKGKSLSSNEGNNIQFITNKYITSSDGTQKREKKARKYKPDDIRKKIKVRFHKKIKNIINESLKKAGSNKLFFFLPQFFLGNISKKFNYQYLNKTFEELLSINFSDFQKDYPNKQCDFRQFLKNKKTLQYLEKNPEISKISGFNELKRLKYKEILRRYFSSIEFEQSIKQLEIENEDNEYIQEYICLAKGYIDYFMDVNN